MGTDQPDAYRREQGSVEPSWRPLMDRDGGLVDQAGWVLAGYWHAW
jgi:hypothetical protein